MQSFFCNLFSGVRQLNLRGRSVTNTGLKLLHLLKQLRELDLSRTKVTAAGVVALQKALPECKIVRDGKEK